MQPEQVDHVVGAIGQFCKKHHVTFHSSARDGFIRTLSGIGDTTTDNEWTLHQLGLHRITIDHDGKCVVLSAPGRFSQKLTQELNWEIKQSIQKSTSKN